MMQTQMTAVLADIGGTNTRVALGSGPVIDEASVRRYRNAPNLHSMPLQCMDLLPGLQVP